MLELLMAENGNMTISKEPRFINILGKKKRIDILNCLNEKETFENSHIK